MPEQHAKIFQPSAAHRWMNCTQSAVLNAELPDSTSTFAEEGTAAHSLCEYKVLEAFKADGLFIREFTDSDPTKSPYYDAEMEECCNAYRDFVIETYRAAKEPYICIEKRLDLTRYMPESFGTGDCIIISEGKLHIIDFKYGKGVEVDATENEQLMCYALGAMEIFSDIYDIDTVVLSAGERLGAEEVLRPAAELASKGEGQYCPGEHCRFCKAKTLCRARAEANLELAKYEFREPPDLSDFEVEEVVKTASQLKDWLEGLQAYMEKKALEGYRWNDYKLVRGRAVRKIVKPEEVAKIFLEQGKDPYKPQELKTLTDLEKLMGKKAFAENCGQFVMKPEGKPTLVPRSDKRTEIGPSDLKTSAAEDFADDI